MEVEKSSSPFFFGRRTTTSSDTIRTSYPPVLNLVAVVAASRIVEASFDSKTIVDLRRRQAS